MPTYEYHCPACSTNYELRQGFDAETTHECEECGKGIAKRVLHAPRVFFKGSGWYVTDSKGKASATRDGKSETKSDSGASSSSEAAASSDGGTATATDAAAAS